MLYNHRQKALQIFFYVILCVLIEYIRSEIDHKQNDLILIEDEDKLHQTDQSVPSTSDANVPIKIFQATNDWKEINDEILPKGLHVRINLETGRKEAKILNDHNDVDVNSQITTNYQIASKKSAKHLSDDEDRFYKDIINLKSKDDLAILNDLEYLVHKTELGSEFLDRKGFEILSRDLDRSGVSQGVRMEILNVFGSAIQSNQYVKTALSKTKFLSRIIDLVGSNLESPLVLRKALFVLSTLLRNSLEDQTKFFIEFEGKKLLKQLFQNNDIKTAIKIFSIFSDITNEIQNIGLDRIDGQSLIAMESIRSAYIDSEICSNIINLFRSNRLERNDQIALIESMIDLVTPCREDFHQHTDSIRMRQSESKQMEYVEEILSKLLLQLSERSQHAEL
ncbi:Nucleotide exchange factor SIL1 [Sarcoptes scabiei]|uniref:Nucleotide exchange factor SIL1 n=1 Tax=Sarcoptes scabiei TaxID=52283 RepID=A0A834RAD4_SARSC|nr:Nucleotide exchange factor SIL1 [Sarcoptes scabiei]